ncbi:bifunctional DNA primase/helicase, partial [Anabaena azotica FACHB-119]|nr:bifunctional DNA primase/helicase [Anabaena azotica FACHB-119]
VEMGNTIVSAGDNTDEAARHLMKAAGNAIDSEHYRQVANAKDIDRKTYDARQHQDYLKPEEALECEKFRIRDTYGMTVTPELVEKDDGGRLIKKIVALEAILAAPGEMITDEHGREFITPPDVVAERDKGERDRLSICTDWGNHSTSWLMRQRLGLRAILTDLMDGLEIKGDEATIEALADFSKRNANHIKGILNLTIPLDESPVWILSQYLSQFALSMKSRRPVEDGKRVRYYRLSTEDVAFVRKVLGYRQRLRDEREKRRQEEREAQAAYAARMQAMYGVNAPSNPPSNIIGNNNCGGVDGQLDPCDSWWQQVKFYATLAMERVAHGVDSVKQFLFTLSSDERWGVMMAIDEAQPEMFEELTATAPDWMAWMG